MHQCSSCQRHIRMLETHCPFCGARSRSLVSMARTVVGAGATAVVLSACYGPGGFVETGDFETGDTDELIDADNDGYYADQDCDDTNPDVNPAAVEDCETDYDDNCNDVVNEDCED